MGTAERGGFRCGTSGYQYDHWQGRFYPKEVARSGWFDHYASVFDSVEINNTFYGLPSADAWDHWRTQAPDSFTYALKFSRYGSHLKHLKDPEGTQATFLEGARALREHLGPILVQLPPRWHPDPGRLRAFLAAAPKDVRWAVEVRNREWLRDDVIGILEDHGAALCIHDLLVDHPRPITTDWAYLRYHGPEGYRGSYPPEKLQGEAGWITARLQEGLDVYAFFNNDQDAHAPENARRLKRLVEGASEGG